MFLKKGSVINNGRYRLIQMIGTDGSKEFWLAHDNHENTDVVLNFDIVVYPVVSIDPPESQRPSKGGASKTDIGNNPGPAVNHSATQSSEELSESFTVNGVTFKMISVEGGTFKMGATPEQGSDAYDSEKPVHSVTLSSFRIGETEVTQELWQAVMGNNPSDYIDKGLQCPVEQISWGDCQLFISKLNQLTGKNFRLPTEAEWKFAARGGNKSRGYKYSGSDNIGSVAWYRRYCTHAVKTKSPNELGIYDMSGNVYEWCIDWYRDTYLSGSVTNPKGPSSGEYRVGRGGSYHNSAVNCRVSNRAGSSQSLRGNDLGLRLAI